MNKKDTSQQKPATSATAPKSKRCADLDKLIEAHCKKKGISRSSCEHAHGSEFNANAHYIAHRNLYVIDGILANDARELMICYVAVMEGLAKVRGFSYTIIPIDDG